MRTGIGEEKVEEGEGRDKKGRKSRKSKDGKVNGEGRKLIDFILPKINN